MVSPGLELSTPEQAEALIGQLRTIDGDLNLELPVTPTESLPDVLHNSFYDVYALGSFDSTGRDEILGSFVDMSPETIRRFYRNNMWLTRFARSAGRTAIYCSAYDVELVPGENHTLRGEVSLVHSVESHVAPRSLRQDLEYQIWEGKDGSILLHRSSEGLLTRVVTNLQSNELGGQLFQRQMEEMSIRRGIVDLEHVANDEPTFEDIIKEELAEHQRYMASESYEPNAKEPHAIEELVAGAEIDLIMNDRSEGVGLVSFEEAEALLHLLQQAM